MSFELTNPLPRTWWLKKAAYFQFMVRELTSVAVLAYTLLILWALWSAAQADAFTQFVEFLRSPLSVVLHSVILLLALYHTGTWIALTPKVLVLWQDDEQFDPNLVAGVNGILFVAISGVLVWLLLA